MKRSKRVPGTHLTALLLCLTLLLSFLPTAARAEEGKTVRVGWFESSFNQTDQYGRRLGYAYEYQQKIAGYTGWRYEYVEGSWPQLLQMLIDGEIDLMSDISYTVGRARKVLFSMVPMGTEDYYVFISGEGDSGVSADDLSTLSGKRVGVNKDSVQATMFQSWASKKGIEAEVVELIEGESEAAEMLRQGEIDALVTIDGYEEAQRLLPLTKIGSSDFYFAVSKARPELLKELDSAMLRIQEENILYSQDLAEKYIKHSSANMYLSEEELAWLSGRGPIRVGYRDNYLAFCAKDAKTGALTGALKEFLALASHSMKNADIAFEPVAFPTTEDALAAMDKGDVDCVFPVNLSLYDAEELGVLITAPLMQSEMYAVVNAAALRDFSLDGVVRAAVNEGNPSYESFLMDYFPDWERVFFKDINACLKAVSEGRADCVIVSNYRINSISDPLEQYKLTTVTTGVTINSFFAIRQNSRFLYSILNKVISQVPGPAINAALASYSYREKRITIGRFIREHIPLVLAGVGIIVALILAFLLRSLRSEKKTREALRRIAELNEEQKKRLNEIALLNTTLSDNQQKLKEALTEAESANRAKTSFLSNMSHEIRTPMNAIIGLDNIALKDQDLAPHTREQLEKISASAKHLLGIINDILDMSRIESGRMTLKDEEFSFREFLDQINVMVNGQCVDKGLDYECRIIGKTEDYYIGDGMKLKQVLINILGNAVKFTDAPGSVTFTVQQPAGFENHRSLRFTIKDTGIGMSKEFIPKIFEAFSQETEGNTSKYGSTGLGMAITKNIVNMMNGDIQVDSEKGVGTTFTVTVTLKVSGRSARADRSQGLPSGLRALVVDDEHVACEHAQLVAESVGMKADIAAGGPQALDMYRAAKAQGKPYQLILTDCNMPGMDGIAFTRALRAAGGDAMVILLTGYSWEDKQEEAAAAGVDAIMSKPLFTDSLTDTVRDILSRRERAAEGAPAAGAGQESAPEGGLQGRRVLVAEDMELNAEILMDLLDMEQVQSELAENGQMAVDMFSGKPAGYYDAILMDVRMPVMTGLDATRAIRALDRPDAAEIPIIAMTANAFDEDVQLSLQAGMNAHLSKPVEPDRLFETLGRLIQRKA